MSTTELMNIDSDSDDNEIILASAIPLNPHRRRSSEGNDEEDFIKKHERIKQMLNKSRKRSSNISNDDNDSSQKSNYLSAYQSLLLPMEEDVTNIVYTQPRTKRDRHKQDTTAHDIDIFDDLIPKTREKKTENEIETVNQKEGEISSDTNTINTLSQNDNEFETKPYLFGDDTTGVMQLIADNEPMIDAEIEHEITVNDMKKQGKIGKMREQKQEGERLQREEEENRLFAETFDKTVFATNKEKTDSNQNESLERQIEDENAFSAAFEASMTKQNKRKRTRNEIDINENRRKRHKPNTQSQTYTQTLSTFDPNDPFRIRFPLNFKPTPWPTKAPLSQPKIHTNKNTFGRQKMKQWSKSHRTATSKHVHNVSQISRTATASNTMIKGSTLLDKLTRNKQRSPNKTNTRRVRTRKKKKDPFSVAMPVMSTPVYKSQTKHVIKREHVSTAETHIPLSVQLQQLTRHKDAMISDLTDANNVELTVTPMSKLPHSKTHKTKKKHRNIEAIQESRTTNHDLQYLQTPQRFKYKTRSNEHELTQQYDVQHMITPKKTNEKEEMDASDDETKEDMSIGTTPQWLHTLAHKAKASVTPHEQTIKRKKISSSERKKACGKWQRDLMDLKLKVAHRYNLVTTYQDSIHSIPATLHVTQMITLKLLRIRRVSYYGLYQSICVYLYENDMNFRYVLLYFQASKLEELQLKKDDFIKIYRPWNDMKYTAMDGHKTTKCTIEVIAGIDNVIKVNDVNKTVVHADQYPKYDVDVFNGFIASRHHTLEGINDHDSIPSEIQPKHAETSTDTHDDGDGDGDDTMMVLDEDESFWLKNIDAIIESERIGMYKSNFIPIAEIARNALFNDTKEYNVRGIIQRVYINEGMKRIRMLIQDVRGYCCMITMDLCYVLQHISNDICSLTSTKLEGIWFEFHGLTVSHKYDEDYDASTHSLLMQFVYLYITETASASYAYSNKEHKKQLSAVGCYGLNLNQGSLLKEGKMYYHFEHFAAKTIANRVENSNSFQMNKEYEKRLELRYFDCKSLHKSASQQTNHSAVQYEASLLIELMQIGCYLKQFWKCKRCSTRISVCARIVAQSLVWHNCYYITDNSLLRVPVNDDLTVQCVPLIIDNMDLFSVILNKAKAKVKDESQPLVVLRDVAMHFRNNDEGNDAHLQLRFDDFSFIDAIEDMKIRVNRRKFNYKYWKYRGLNIMNMDCLIATPWIALHSSMVTVEGIVELVAINDGFDVRCVDCRDISTQNFEKTVTENEELKEDQCAEGIACIACLKQKGEIRLVIKRQKNTNDFVVVCVPVVNIWCESQTHANGIVEALHWETNEMYNEGLNKLKCRLNDLVGNDVKQCIIEYLPNTTNNDTSIENVKCFQCFHCVI